MYTRYKTPALVNLDFSVTFTPRLLLKDMDLGLAAARKFGVQMPTAAITRECVQNTVGRGYEDVDFSVLLLELAKAAGMTLEAENVKVGDGLTPRRVRKAGAR
jgi:3-hydroxyisobutyrate dehydrogenase